MLLELFGQRPYLPKISGITALVSMAFGQNMMLNQSSWGVTPGYGDKWPSAKTAFERVSKARLLYNDLSLQT